MSAVVEALQKYNEAMGALESAEDAVQAALQHIRDAAGSATIEVSGEYFQIRKRKDKLYLCEFNGKPKGRPAGIPSKRKAKAAAPLEGNTEEIVFNLSPEVAAELSALAREVEAEAKAETSAEAPAEQQQSSQQLDNDTDLAVETEIVAAPADPFDNSIDAIDAELIDDDNEELPAYVEPDAAVVDTANAV